MRLRDGGSAHAAHVYAVITPDAEYVAPSQEYLELVRAAALSRGLPQSYLAGLDALTPGSR